MGMTENPNNNNTKRRLVLLTAGILVSAVIVIGLVMWAGPLSPVEPASSQSTTTKIESVGETTQIDFYFHICGDEKDPTKVAGTPENPAKVSRASNEIVTIPFCVSTDANSSKVLILGQVSPEQRPVPTTSLENGSIEGVPVKGISVTLDKSSLNLLTSAASNQSTGENNAIYDNFNASIKVSSDAELGIHRFGISAFHPDETGVRGIEITQQVYVKIVD